MTVTPRDTPRLPVPAGTADCDPSEPEPEPAAADNRQWSVEQDGELMAWATHQPHDWQMGGGCSAFLWGSGRHGQVSTERSAGVTLRLGGGCSAFLGGSGRHGQVSTERLGHRSSSYGSGGRSQMCARTTLVCSAAFWSGGTVGGYCGLVLGNMWTVGPDD